MPEVKRKPSPRGDRSSPEGDGMMLRSAGLMGHRSIISLTGAFGSINSEEREILERTLADRRGAWGQPGTEPLSKARAAAILKRKESRSTMIGELLLYCLYAFVYVTTLTMQRPILEAHYLENAIEAAMLKQKVRSRPRRVLSAS